MSEKTITLVLVDDHALLREALRTQFKSEGDIEVVGAVSRADEAVRLSKELKPDVLLMDIDMPGQSCFEAAKKILARSPETRILFLTAFFHDRYIEQALKAQAWGYITKDETPEKVVAAIRGAMSGMAYFSPKAQARIVIDAGGSMHLSKDSRSRTSLLTNREVEVVRYLARGLTKKEVAGVMHISVKTVEMHTQKAMDKLDIHDRVALARFAIREGLAEA